MKALILLLSMMLVSFTAANAEVYKWVDDDGNMHFSDSPPPKQKTEEVRLQTASTPTPQRSGSVAPDEADTGNEAKAEPSDRDICKKAIRNLGRYVPAWERRIKAKMPDMSPGERADAERSLAQLNNNMRKIKTSLDQCVSEMDNSTHRSKTECMANAENDTMAMFCVM